MLNIPPPEFWWEVGGRGFERFIVDGRIMELLAPDYTVVGVVGTDVDSEFGIDFFAVPKASRNHDRIVEGLGKLEGEPADDQLRELLSRLVERNGVVALDTTVRRAPAKVFDLECRARGIREGSRSWIPVAVLTIDDVRAFVEGTVTADETWSKAISRTVE